MRSHIVTSCDMAATVERAECKDAAAADRGREHCRWKKWRRQEQKTIEDVAAFLKLDKTQTMKALLFVTYDNGRQ